MKTVLAWSVFLAVVIFSGRAAAQELIVLESNAGKRPPGADALLEPFFEELSQKGYLADPAQLRKRVHEKVSRSGEPLSPEQLAEMTRLVEEGYHTHWIKGQFDEAIRKLGRALGAFRAHPATIAEKPDRRDLVLTALVGLALANKRLGRAEEASKSMADVVRDFRDRDFNRTLFGPEAHDLYRAVTKELTEQGTGSIRVALDDDNAVVFVNEKYEAQGNAIIKDLVPGRYRVFVKKGADEGRVHEVDVVPGQEQKVSISWAFDRAFKTGQDSVGFAFASAAERDAKEARYATQVARALGASGVIVVGIRPYRGRQAIVGQVLSLDSAKPLRTGVLAVEPAEPSAAQVRGLARFLADGDPVPGVIVPDGPLVATMNPGPDVAPGRSFGAWKWVALGVGVASVAGGVTLIAIDGERDDGGSRNPERYETKTAGIGLTAAGGALVATGVVLWLLEEDAPATTVTPAAGGGVMFTWQGGF